ncbi:MAG: TonB family protein [Opitutaceae bacterium]
MKPKNATGAFIASVILHGGLAGLAILLMLFKPPEKPEPAIFEMVSIPEQTDTTEESVDIAFEPLPAEPVVIPIPEPIPEPPPVVEKKPEPKPEPKPVEKKPEPPPKQISYEEFVKKQGAPKEQKPRPVAPKPITVPKIDTSRILDNLRNIMVDTTSLSRMSQSEMNALDAYFARLREQLKRAWAKPEGLSDRLQCDVQFDVSSSGVLSGARVVSASGNPEFDRSVLAAFAAVRKFGPTPDGRSYPARVTFRMTD